MQEIKDSYGGRVNEALLKQLTAGNDSIEIRELFKGARDVKLYVKVILCCNHLPKIVGTDNGIWRRVVLVPFETIFREPGEELKEGEHYADYDIGTKVKSREWKSAFLGILTEYWLQYCKTKLKPSSRIENATKDFKQDRDIYMQFVEQYVELGKGKEYRIVTREVMERFETFYRDELRKRGVMPPFESVKGELGRFGVKWSTCTRFEGGSRTSGFEGMKWAALKRKDVGGACQTSQRSVGEMSD